MTQRSFKTNVRASVPQLSRILLPVRVNLLGGWSDQLLWEHEAAVINASVGWNSPGCFDQYPLMILKADGFRSVVSGVGTGLGISSIKAAGEFLLGNPFGDYVGAALQWEWLEGTRGGWQDQIGSIQPGFKLITTPNHTDFHILSKESHPVMDHMVLFDSGIRRRSETIGSRIRDLFFDGGFVGFVKELVERTKDSLDSDANVFIESCLWSWQRFVGFVPEMDIDIPIDRELCFGKMMVGAGGGGYGVVFCKEPESCRSVIDQLNGKGLWAVQPVVLPGAKFVWE